MKSILFRGALAAAALAVTVVAGCASAPANTAAPSATTRPIDVDAPIASDSATLVVYGLSCPQCANNVDQQLYRLPGVKGIENDLGTGEFKVTLTPNTVTRAQLASAIEEASYTLKEIRVP